MKKIIVLVLAVVMMMSIMTGCGATTPQGNVVSAMNTATEDVKRVCEENMYTDIPCILIDGIFVILDSDKAMDEYIKDSNCDWMDKTIIDEDGLKVEDWHCMATSMSMPFTLSDLMDGQTGAYSRAMHLYFVTFIVYPDGGYHIVDARTMV